MEFRNIFIENPASLRIRNHQLLICQEQEIAVPLEDICSILLESLQINVTAAVMTQMASCGITVFFCDEKHLPCAQILSINQYHRQLKLLRSQIDLAKPLQKKLWQKIVKRKIKNQAFCLQFMERDGAIGLRQKEKEVCSGDSGNVEAVAAALYFPQLYGREFSRGNDCIQNAALNYGYAILRGAIARNLVMHGLEPCLGIHHRSELNRFNLADDLIEPFRPLVDLFVASYEFNESEEITPEIKRQLFNLTNYLVLQDGKKYRVMTAIERMTVSIAKSIREGQDLIELPELLPLELHHYE